MSSISEQFNKARFKSEELKSTFDEMEFNKDVTFDQFSAFESDMAAHFKQIEDLLQKIKDEKPDTRALWIKYWLLFVSTSRRVQPMKDDYYRLKTDFTRFQTRKIQQMSKRQLLSRDINDIVW